MEEPGMRWKGTGQMRRQPLLKEASLKSQESDSVMLSCKISSYQLNVPVILRELFRILQNCYEEIIAKMEKFVKSAFPLIFLEVHVHRVLQLHAFLSQQKCLFRPAGDEAAGVVYDAVAGKISVV